MTIAIIAILIITNTVFIIREAQAKKAMRRLVAKAEQVIELQR